ncbi:TonB-dependent receptor domain-containing protein [Sphingomonas sp.]|uniref:TonB-dependent receptor domain-containing protein n=1 Tax=Sphingomonas sp. TaxID=28214 RepID=UPI00286AB77A|nr:TonB-dependent receptor [Sphingomonas sp.]
MISASVGALIFANPALAQDAPATNDQAAAAQIPTDVNSAPDTKTDETTIVVTGTRIRQPEFTSSDPVTSIDPKIAKREGKLDFADALQSSPIAAGSAQITAAISSNLVTNGGPGAQSIDLRGLGANRTLVLLNGRRAGPAGTRGGVSSFDLNVLPQSIVSRVDILKTGASSIYGSDAVAGVVNILTDTDRNGFELDGSVSAPLYGAGQSYQISGSWGKKFDRGHILIAADYYRQKELSRGDLNYLGCPEANVFTDESHGTRADLVDPRTGKYHCEDLRWGHVWTYETGSTLYTTTGRYTAGPGYNLLQYQYPGENLNLPPIDPSLGFSAPPGWFPTGYDTASASVQNAYHPFVDQQSIIPSTKRYTIYGDASYEFSDGIEAYAEFLGNRRQTYQNAWRQLWTYGYGEDIYPDNPWGQGWSGDNVLSPLTITNHSDSKQKVDYLRGVGGLRGNLGGLLKGWSYDAYVQYSHNKGLYSSEQFLQDVYDSSYYQSASCVGQTLPFSGKQCIDLPWTDPFFLAGQMTPAQIDYMFDWETGKTIYNQLSGEGSITGNLFDLPAGPVGVALGITARRDSIVDTPGSITYSANPYYDPTIPLTSTTCTKHFAAEPFYPCQQFHSNAWGVSSGGITAGHSVTKEAFGELSIPLFKDKPFFRDLSLSAAGRVTNVTSVQRDTGITDHDNGNFTYKVGGNWAINRWLRFRGTYGTSFRAPALFEQFKANETAFVTTSRVDPCRRIDANLAANNISQQVHDRCLAELTALGVPNPLTYGGGTVSATVVSQGGIGVLNPETSVAKTASVILTPTFAFLPDTRFSVAVDYFDIKVKGEVSQLGASAILKQCYNSATFPNQYCDLFSRSGTGTPDPGQILTINDKYINIAEQQTKGIDVTGLVQHEMGTLGQLSFLANMSWTLKQSFALFAGQNEDLLGVIDLDNGTRTGTRRWVGDFRLTWRVPSGWTFFWGTEIFSGASNEKEFRANNGGSLCVDSFNLDIDGNPTNIPLRGHYCVNVKVPATWYHNASITKEIGKKFELTLGMRNVFNTKPPKVSLIGGTGIPGTIGPVLSTSQYDFLGRRMFINVSRKF